MEGNDDISDVIGDLEALGNEIIEEFELVEDHDLLDSSNQSSVTADFPQLSPREKLNPKTDKYGKREIDIYMKKHHATILKLVSLIEAEVLQNKPENVLDFIANNFFEEGEAEERTKSILGLLK